MVPNPVRIWREYGETRCTSCWMFDRCVYVQTPDRQQHELCWGCFRARYAGLIRACLLTAYQKKHPDQIVRIVHSRESITRALACSLEAIRLRMYLTPGDHKKVSSTPLETSIRHACWPLEWAYGQSEHLDMIIRKVLPKDRRVVVGLDDPQDAEGE